MEQITVHAENKPRAKAKDQRLTNASDDVTCVVKAALIALVQPSLV
jgi:hypothetical protein